MNTISLHHPFIHNQEILLTALSRVVKGSKMNLFPDICLTAYLCSNTGIHSYLWMYLVLQQMSKEPWLSTSMRHGENTQVRQIDLQSSLKLLQSRNIKSLLITSCLKLARGLLVKEQVLNINVFASFDYLLLICEALQKSSQWLWRAVAGHSSLSASSGYLENYQVFANYKWGSNYHFYYWRYCTTNSVDTFMLCSYTFQLNRKAFYWLFNAVFWFIYNMPNRQPKGHR